MTAVVIPAAHEWPTNAHLIEDVAALGYLRSEWKVLDPTYGKGTFWKRWRPGDLFRADLNPLKSPDYPHGMDVRNMPFPAGAFQAVVFDGPYKLNGTSAEDGDHSYGVDEKASWQDRHALIRDGMTECARVLSPKPRTSARARGGFLLVKCQAQVCGGAVRWQDIEFTGHAVSLGLVLVDRFDVLGTGRPQPPRSRKDGKPSVQHHGRGRPSTLLVFRKTS